MAIREKLVEGKVTYEVSVNVRSQVVPGVRVQRYRGGLTSKADAKKIERELFHEASVELGRKEGTGVSWAELLEKWEVAHLVEREGQKRLQKTTIWDNAQTLRKFTGTWMKRNCAEITPGDVRKVLQAMQADGYSYSRRKAVKSAVTSVFRWGIEEGQIKGAHHPPTLGVDLGKAKDERPPDILNFQEIQRLLAVARSMDHQWYPIWAMALNTGMRSGELFALEWTDVDFENRLLTVSKSYNGRLKITKSTKAGYWRKVPMNGELERLLLELRRKSGPGNIHVLPRINQWQRGEAAKVLREFCGGIGISSVNFHALRACFATHLLNSGVSTPVVKKICGWTDEKVMSRYIRLAGVDVAGATDKLGFKLPEISGDGLVNLADFHGQRS